MHQCMICTLYYKSVPITLCMSSYWVSLHAHQQKYSLYFFFADTYNLWMKLIWHVWGWHEKERGRPKDGGEGGGGGGETDEEGGCWRGRRTERERERERESPEWRMRSSSSAQKRPLQIHRAADLRSRLDPLTDLSSVPPNRTLHRIPACDTAVTFIARRTSLGSGCSGCERWSFPPLRCWIRYRSVSAPPVLPAPPTGLQPPPPDRWAGRGHRRAGGRVWSPRSPQAWYQPDSRAPDRQVSWAARSRGVGG